MISVQDAIKLSNESTNLRRETELKANMERASIAIQSAAKAGNFNVEVELPGTHPQDFVDAMTRIGYRAILVTGYYDERRLNPCNISWFPEKTTSKVQTSSMIPTVGEFEPMPEEWGPWVHWCECPGGSKMVARDLYGTCAACKGHDGHQKDLRRKKYPKSPATIAYASIKK